MTKRRAYRARTISGAQREVRRLMLQLEESRAWAAGLYKERNLLARLAADGPAFDNPLVVAWAKHVRDRILREHFGLAPDGTILPVVSRSHGKET